MKTPAAFLLAPSPELGDRPKAFGVCLGILTFFGFWVTLFGFKVGGARSKHRDQAAKNGEKNTEARYAYPNLYVDGNTKPARAFNCKQRSHQHIFETLPQVRYDQNRKPPESDIINPILFPAIVLRRKYFGCDLFPHNGVYLCDCCICWSCRLVQWILQ